MMVDADDSWMGYSHNNHASMVMIAVEEGWLTVVNNGWYWLMMAQNYQQWYWFMLMLVGIADLFGCDKDPILDSEDSSPTKGMGYSRYSQSKRRDATKS